MYIKIFQDLLLIIIICLAFSSCKLNKDEDYKEIKGLSFQETEANKIKINKIKSVSVFEYGYTFEEPNLNGELVSITYYDTNGCEIKREEHFKEDGTATVKYFHTYDSTGRRISTIDELYINNNKPYNKTIYRYDSYGNFSEAVYYYMTGNVAWKELYHYNEKGLLDKIVQDNKTKHEYSYDSSNQLIQSTKYGNESMYSKFIEPDYIEIWNYRYKDGKIFEALQYDKYKEPYKVRKYEYSFY